MERPIPERAVHGGLAQSEQQARGWLDFSANLNPFPPQVPWVPDTACLEHYPDDRYPALKEAIARTFGRRADEVTVGNGSIEVIRSFALATLRPGDRVRIDGPTFGEYRVAAELAGARVVSDTEEVSARFLCNPNNPTGGLLDRAATEEVLAGTPDGTRVFVDEAFIELADPASSLIDRRDDRVVVLRSMTKEFAVPGLRLGFGIGEPGLIDRCECCRAPWSVNAFAEAFAMAALREYGALEESRRRIRDERGRLAKELVALGFDPMPASANFICAQSLMAVSDLSAGLARHRIKVRDCASFGLPECVRIAVRTRDENRRLVEAMAACSP